MKAQQHKASLGFTNRNEIAHLMPPPKVHREYVFLRTDCTCREINIDKVNLGEMLIDLNSTKAKESTFYHMGQFEESGVSPYENLLVTKDREQLLNEAEEDSRKRLSNEENDRSSVDSNLSQSWDGNDANLSPSSSPFSVSSEERSESLKEDGLLNRPGENSRSPGELQKSSGAKATAAAGVRGAPAAAGKASHKVSRKSQLSAMTSLHDLSTDSSFLIVWHRYTELPLDVSVGQFKVQRPVQPLMQGGHLLRVTCDPVVIGADLLIKIVRATDFKAVNQQIAKGFRAHAYLKDELLVLRKVSHPNVAKLLYYFETPHHYFSIFPPYTPIDLFFSEHNQEDSKLTRATKILRKTAAAVEYLYRNYIIHRDISAMNIRTGNNGEPVLFNFHYATFFGTKVSKLMPTFLPKYFTRAPEVVSPNDLSRSNTVFYNRCDIWGLGALFGELLLGQRLMQSTLRKKLDLNWIFSVRVQLVESQLTMEAFRILRRCLKKLPEDRPDIYRLMRQLSSVEF